MEVPDATPPGPDAGDALPSDPLDEISDATREPFHLVVDGVASDGSPRLIYMPKTIWLATTTPFVDDLQISLRRSDFLFTISGELTPFGRAGLTELHQLFAEAEDAGFKVVPGTLALPHVVCGWANPELFESFTLASTCDDEPTLQDWLSVPFSVTTTTATDELAVRIEPLLASGGAWDEILGGTITWRLPSGASVESKLEISCVGAEPTFGGDQSLFASAACRARYAR